MRWESAGYGIEMWVSHRTQAPAFVIPKAHWSDVNMQNAIRSTLKVNGAAIFSRVSLPRPLMIASSVFFWPSFFSCGNTFLGASAAKNFSWPFRPFLPVFSWAKYESVMDLKSAPPRSTLVLVAMQYRWFTRFNGTPLRAKGPVTKSRPLSNCFKKTTRFPRNLLASRIRIWPGWMFLRNFGAFFSTVDFTFFTVFLGETTQWKGGTEPRWLQTIWVPWITVECFWVLNTVFHPTRAIAYHSLSQTFSAALKLGFL